MRSDLFDLTGRTALVTGASSGIGREIAVALASAGAGVVLAARRQERLEDARRQIENDGGRAVTVAVDLSNPAAIEKMPAHCVNALGTPDILVNAAGVNPRMPVEQLDLQVWQDTLHIHLTAPFLLARSLSAGMRERGWGRIINLASLQSYRAFADGLPYGTAKGGLIQMTRAMAQAWSRFGINCNAIGPGFFPTELTASVFADKELSRYHAQRTMIGRNGELSDLHGITIFLAASASDYITGQTIYVDGGYTAQ